MSIGPDDQDQVVRAIMGEIREMSTQAVVLSQVIADRLGMNPTDVECLGVVAAEGSLTAGRLADLSGLTTGAITGVVDRLEKSGYVQRENDPTDRRRVIIRACAERQAELEEPFAGVTSATLELLAHYDAVQLATIRDFIVEANGVGRSQIARLREQTTKAARRTFPRRKRA
ncbi:MAG: MarR family transcriptional regulator [Chloroflexota bacterium]|nr:MarR family transcriptional regulator [Chloroflexota bacterium]